MWVTKTHQTTGPYDQLNSAAFFRLNRKTNITSPLCHWAEKKVEINDLTVFDFDIIKFKLKYASLVSNFSTANRSLNHQNI